MMNYCEDYPCCGHTDRDPCPGRAVVDEPWYCDDCGINHYGECPGEPDEDDEDEPEDEGYYFSGTGEWSEDTSYEDYLNR
jgi:hypothetical protein